MQLISLSIYLLECTKKNPDALCAACAACAILRNTPLGNFLGESPGKNHELVIYNHKHWQIWSSRSAKNLCFGMPGHKSVPDTVFLDEQYKRYLCPKCEHLLRDAVQPTCGHWLCQSCADETFEESESGGYDKNYTSLDARAMPCAISSIFMSERS